VTYFLLEIGCFIALCFLLSFLMQCGFTYVLMKHLYGTNRVSRSKKKESNNVVATLMGFTNKPKRKPKVMDDRRAIEIERRQQQH